MWLIFFYLKNLNEVQYSLFFAENLTEVMITYYKSFPSNTFFFKLLFQFLLRFQNHFKLKF